MIDTYTGKKITRAMGSIWPAPAVQYHMTSGRVARVSFWAPSKASPQELIERGAMVACSMIPTHGVSFLQDRMPVTHPLNPPYDYDDRILRLYVEDKTRPGLPFHVYQGDAIDPWNPPELAKIKAPRTSVKQVKTILAEVLSILDGKADAAKARLVLAQAQELLAA